MSTGAYPIYVDDGYASAFYTIYPILKKYGIPATLAVITDRVGKPGYVTWENVKELDDNGWDIVNHTTDHAPLDLQKEEQQERKILGAMNALRDNGLVRRSDFLVFPYGAWNDKTSAVMKKLGIVGARGTRKPGEKKKRFPITPEYDIEAWALNTRTSVAKARELACPVIFHDIGVADQWTEGMVADYIGGIGGANG